MREERDSLGVIEVPADRYWGAQTQRALQNFPIGERRMPLAIIHALARIKRLAARVNADLGLLSADKADAIVRAAVEVEQGQLDDHFPLPIWQTGSGTQTNMNVNEVIANRAIEILGGQLGSRDPVHPNDHVNLGQSSNDTVGTALHVAVVDALSHRLLPALEALHAALTAKAQAFAAIVKVGRTHLMDAAPVTLGQEFSGYAAQVAGARDGILRTRAELYEVAQGATAVGTGLNAHPAFGARVAAALAAETGHPFRPAGNRFAALAAHDALVSVSGELKRTAVALFKIASDVRLLASGPRCGLGEIALPANEPGSSIMPGKVNPTQSEALIMVCAQVIGLDAAVAIGGLGGQLELNVCKPLIGANVLEAASLLGDAAASFRERCVEGITADEPRIAEFLRRNVMLVTALAPVIGYDRAAQVAQKAQAERSSLRDAAIALGFMSAAEFDAHVRPEDMVGP